MSSLRDNFLVCLLALFLSQEALALSTDRDEPINIEADRAEADNAKRITTYYGDVIITQGTLKITGDTVTIEYDDQESFCSVKRSTVRAEIWLRPSASCTTR
jgi:lipopolysaccharide export system protein LptA